MTDEAQTTETFEADMASIRAEYARIVRDVRPHGTEANIIQDFRDGLNTAMAEKLLPMSPMDSTLYEMALRYGRADIVIFHVDGSASVIEAKDGAKGYGHVVSGIGQVGLYAVQLMMTKGALSKVRKCLMWSSTGDPTTDATITITCLLADVIPIRLLHIRQSMALRMAVEGFGGVRLDGRSP